MSKATQRGTLGCGEAGQEVAQRHRNPRRGARRGPGRARLSRVGKEHERTKVAAEGTLGSCHAPGRPDADARGT